LGWAADGQVALFLTVASLATVPPVVTEAGETRKRARDSPESLESMTSPCPPCTCVQAGRKPRL